MDEIPESHPVVHDDGTVEVFKTPVPSLPVSRLSTDGGNLSGNLPLWREKHEGLRVLAYVNHSPVCKQALQLARVLLHDRCSELTLAYCAPNPYAYEGMVGVLEDMAEPLEAAGFNVKCELFTKNEEQQTVIEALSEYVHTTMPDLVILGSTSLGNDAKLEEEMASKNRRVYVGVPDSWVRSASKPSRQAFAVKLAQHMRATPLLIVKANSKGSLFASPGVQATGSAAGKSLGGASTVWGAAEDRLRPPLKVMVDLQSTSRHMLDWAFRVLNAEKDQLHLVVSKAYDAGGTEAAEKALPPVIQEDGIDMLMIQAPRSRDLSPYVINLLCAAKTAVMIWPPEADTHALGRKQSPAEADGEQPSSLARDLQTRASINASMSGRGGMLSGDGGSTMSGPVATALRSLSAQVPDLSVGGASSVYAKRPSGAGSVLSTSGSISSSSRAFRASTSLPAARRSFNSSGSGNGRYNYLGETPPVDRVTEAAMAAMAARVQRRRDAEESMTAGALNSQRRGAVL